MASPNRQKLLLRIARIGNDAIEIGAQRLYVRLHAYASPSLRPYELLREFSRAGLLPLRPVDQRFTEHRFPLAQRAPDVTIGRPEKLGRVANRAGFGYGREQLEQRIAQGGATLLSRLEAVTQVNANPILRGASLPGASDRLFVAITLGGDFDRLHPPNVPVSAAVFTSP